MGDNIRFISTTTVHPTSQIDESTRRIELTPWDLQLLLVDFIQKGLLFHKPTSSGENEGLINSKGLIEHLKSSLSRTLDIFYHLAGRLAITENEDDNTTSFSVDCNGAGAEFVHAVADSVTVAEILGPVLVPDEIVYSFFTMNGVLNESISKPLLSVQVTELVDGIFIGCSMNHCVADGASFWRFFNTWSEILRAGNCNQNLHPPRPLVLGREFLDGIIDLPARIPSFHSQIPDKFIPPFIQQRVFHFSKEKIAHLKARANAEMGETKISSLQALLAHLWVSITRANQSHLNPGRETKYSVIVSMRQRLQPALPDEYLGNAVVFGMVKSTASELLNHGLGWAALEMNKMIASKTEQEARKFLEEWIKSPKLFKMSTLSIDSLTTGSSPRFNVFGNDFGWGRPLAVRSGVGNKFNGKLTVFPGAEDGSIDFEACLSPQTLQALAEDQEFMESVAS